MGRRRFRKGEGEKTEPKRRGSRREFAQPSVPSQPQQSPSHENNESPSFHLSPPSSLFYTSLGHCTRFGSLLPGSSSSSNGSKLTSSSPPPSSQLLRRQPSLLSLPRRGIHTFDVSTTLSLCWMVSLSRFVLSRALLILSNEQADVDDLLLPSSPPLSELCRRNAQSQLLLYCGCCGSILLVSFPPP